MWTIESVTVNGAPSSGVFMSDGQSISTERGPAGVSIRMIADAIGFLDFTDLGTWQAVPIIGRSTSMARPIGMTASGPR